MRHGLVAGVINAWGIRVDRSANCGWEGCVWMVPGTPMVNLRPAVGFTIGAATVMTIFVIVTRIVISVEA
jgi:hypothetical protein